MIPKLLRCVLQRRAGSGAFFVILAVVFARIALAQTVFQAPEEAMQELVRAMEAGDTQTVLAILGPEGEQIISSGDQVSDAKYREKFIAGYHEKVDFVRDKDRVSVILGKNNWPMAVPIVRTGAGWAFDTKAGLQELLKRRIGRNELAAVKACVGYVEAQREYASADRALDGIMQYAQRFCSTPGKRDGLYWEEVEGQPVSPLGPAFALAAGEGYQSGRACFLSPEPYHGYFYKILTAQGPAAAGGAYSYIINGHMVAGFALVAWPAEYAVSGVMTFIVNQNGIVYEKNLGPKTAEAVKAMKAYNPDPSWSRAQ